MDQYHITLLEKWLTKGRYDGIRKYKFVGNTYYILFNSFEKVKRRQNISIILFLVNAWGNSRSILSMGFNK